MCFLTDFYEDKLSKQSAQDLSEACSENIANQEMYYLSNKLSFQRKQKKISPPQFYFKLWFYSVFTFIEWDVHKWVTEIKEGEGPLWEHHNRNET